MTERSSYTYADRFSGKLSEEFGNQLEFAQNTSDRISEFLLLLANNQELRSGASMNFNSEHRVKSDDMDPFKQSLKINYKTEYSRPQSPSENDFLFRFGFNGRINISYQLDCTDMNEDMYPFANAVCEVKSLDKRGRIQEKIILEGPEALSEFDNFVKDLKMWYLLD